MKFLTLFLTLLLFTSLSFAKGKGKGDDEALYVVPAAAEYIQNSRFIIDIVEPFKNSETKIISYIFPALLVGEKNRVIEFTRNAEDPSLWHSEQLTASCVAIDDIFSCNIYMNKNDFISKFINSTIDLILKPTVAEQKLNLNSKISLEKTNNFIDTLTHHTMEQRNIFKSVAKAFYHGEPAGILSYEFK